jgi:hypothetical protein
MKPGPKKKAKKQEIGFTEHLVARVAWYCSLRARQCASILACLGPGLKPKPTPLTCLGCIFLCFSSAFLAELHPRQMSQILPRDFSVAATAGHIPMARLTCAMSGAPAPLQLLPDRRSVSAYLRLSKYYMDCKAVRLTISWAATTEEETLVVVTSADLKCMGPADRLWQTGVPRKDNRFHCCAFR